MNPFIQLKNTTPVLLLALICFGLLPTMRAVSPPPDGGYPGGNTADGQNALFSLTTGGYNTAVGWSSLRSDSIGSYNTAIGAGTLLVNTADQNTATGTGALLNNIGTSNTANGAFALSNNTTGNVNTAIGNAALLFNTTGINNIALGFAAGNGVTTADHVICIGSSGANVSPSCFIGNIRNVQTANPDAIPVMIDSAGQLGTASSSRRFKKEIKPMERTSEAILALKPVTFHYKSDKANTPQFGLVAEDVAEVNPDLVVRDENGEIYTVRYEAINAMLLNEFLKEHRDVEEHRATITQLKSDAAKQEATITQLKSTVTEQKKDFLARAAQQEKEIRSVTANLKAQAAQIQKVSAQLEESRRASQTVLNNH
jgi:Chaperone of endosialidase